MELKFLNKISFLKNFFIILTTVVEKSKFIGSRCFDFVKIRTEHPESYETIFIENLFSLETLMLTQSMLGVPKVIGKTHDSSHLQYISIEDNATPESWLHKNF